jgi:thymidylate synthase
MFTAEFDGINTFLAGISQLLLEKGKIRKTRGFNCYELPEPILIKINNPLARLVTIPIRKWNCFLPYIESLWIASGRNDLKMVNHYVKNIKNFSDDLKYIRGAYGPRIRCYNGKKSDYKIDTFLNNNETANENKSIDQFKFIEKTFQKDKNTRQAIITIGDPNKDFFNNMGEIKETLDFPCTRNLHFILNSYQKLDLIVNMRSNDIIWGASAVNIFNFTFMQEYFSKILNFEIGNYYHIVSNLHYYENFQNQVIGFAELKNVNDNDFYSYSKTFNNLSEFDLLLKLLSEYEEDLRINKSNKIFYFKDDFFYDWANIFYYHATKQVIKFKNPYLENIIRSIK